MPKEKKASLKVNLLVFLVLSIMLKNEYQVIHYHLDHPEVASVILSNNALDAAKMNRALQLFQSLPSRADLRSLARGQ